MPVPIWRTIAWFKSVKWKYQVGILLSVKYCTLTYLNHMWLLVELTEFGIVPPQKDPITGDCPELPSLTSRYSISFEHGSPPKKWGDVVMSSVFKNSLPCQFTKSKLNKDNWTKQLDKKLTEQKSIDQTNNQAKINWLKSYWTISQLIQISSWTNHNKAIDQLTFVQLSCGLDSCSLDKDESRQGFEFLS